jgi:hypothetical protein
MIVNGYTILPGASLIGAQLQGENLRGFDLTGADLRGANLRDSVLTGATLTGAQLLFAHLEGANLTGAVLTNAKLQGAHLEGVDLQRLDLRGVDLKDAVLTGANLTGSDLRGAQLQHADLTGAVLTDAKLQGAHLEGAHLEGATLNVEQMIYAQTQRAILFPEIPEENDDFPQGRAFEIHNYFKTLDIDEITKFLENYNNLNTITVNTITVNTITGTYEDTLFSPLLRFIQNSNGFLPEEKEDYTKKINYIFGQVNNYDGFTSHKGLFDSTIQFVSRQEDNFIEQYIRTLVDDCLNAYGDGQQSCLKGMTERIVTVLGEVARILTIGQNKDDQNKDHQKPIYVELKTLFNIGDDGEDESIDFNGLVQEWSTTYLEDGEKHNELLGLAEGEQRKQHFIDFMTNKYKASDKYNDDVYKKISKAVEDYDNAGVFDRGSFGGKGKRKGRNNTKKNKGSKRNIKKIKDTKKNIKKNKGSKKNIKKNKDTKRKTKKRNYQK